MSWKDRKDSRVRDAEPRPEYPWIQWVNRGADLDPRRKQGGFFLTSENLAVLGDPEIPGAEASSLVFSNQDTATGIYMPRLEIAVLADRFGWRVREGNRTYISPTYESGARGKLQVLCLLKTEDGSTGPLVITLTGTVSKDMRTAITAHRQVVQTATGGQGATAWFWLPLAAGKPELRGTEGASSTVTPIIYDKPAVFDPDSFYVGDELADWMEDNFDEIERWRTAWEQRPQPQPQPEPPMDAGEVPPPEVIDDLAAARSAWSNAWNELKRAGITAPLLDSSWDAKQIMTAVQILQESLAALAVPGVKPETVALDLQNRMSRL